MSRLRFTRRAREDLLDIWLYIEPRNPHVADQVYDRIEKRCHLLRDHPQLGPDVVRAAQAACPDEPRLFVSFSNMLFGESKTLPERVNFRRRWTLFFDFPILRDRCPFDS